METVSIIFHAANKRKRVHGSAMRINITDHCVWKRKFTCH